MLNNQIYRGMHHGFITSIAAIGDNLFTASQDGTIQLWDLNTAEPKHTCKWHTKAVRVLHLSKDLGCLFSAGADRTLFRSVGVDLHPSSPSCRMCISFRLPIVHMDRCSRFERQAILRDQCADGVRPGGQDNATIRLCDTAGYVGTLQQQMRILERQPCYEHSEANGVVQGLPELRGPDWRQ